MIIKLLLATLSIFITAYILPGVHLDGFTAALVLAVVLSLINHFIRPILLLFTLPLNILSLGLFTFVIMALCTLLASWLVPGFHVDGFFWALAFAVLLTLVKKVLSPANF